MRPFFCSAFFLSVLLCVVNDARGQTFDSEFQVWNETNFVLPVVRTKDEKGKTTDRVSLFLLTNLRLGQNRLAPVDERIGAGLEIPLNKYFTFSPAYLYDAAQPSPRRREFEHRLRFELGFAYKFTRFTIKDRSRVEYRIRHSRKDSVRYRNQFSLHIPVRKNDKDLIVPFISTEPYYDFTLERITRNDLAVGFARKLSDQVTATFFGGWRHNIVGAPKDVFPVGVNFRIKLR